MEEYCIDKDIKVFYVTALTFPAGVKAAHALLQSKLPSVKGRAFFGISWPDERGNIQYKAAVKEQYDGEAEQYGCEIFIIRQGNYIAATLSNWQADETAIGKTFMNLLKHPGIDKKGYCVEIYPGDGTIKCMVPLQHQPNM